MTMYISPDHAHLITENPRFNTAMALKGMIGAIKAQEEVSPEELVEHVYAMSKRICVLEEAMDNKDKEIIELREKLDL